MFNYFIPITLLEAEDGITLSAKMPKGAAFAAGAGKTYAEAEKQLRRHLNETLAGMIEDHQDPFLLIQSGEAPKGALILGMKDLFPILVRKYRFAKGWTQKEVGDRMQISQSAYSKYEQYGINPTLENLDRIQLALETDLQHFWNLRVGA